MHAISIFLQSIHEWCLRKVEYGSVLNISDWTKAISEAVISIVVMVVVHKQLDSRDTVMILSTATKEEGQAKKKKKNRKEKERGKGEWGK